MNQKIAIKTKKSGFTYGRYKYLGPYNNIDQQLEYDKIGQITNYNVKPYNKADEIASKHDVIYSIGENKNECDRKMVKELDNLTYGDMTKWKHLARFLIDTKEKLGMALSKQPSSDWKLNLAEDLHKPIKRKFPRRCVLVSNINDIFAVDLVDMTKFS